MKYKNFAKQITLLGANDTERSQKLGVSTKTITRYRNGVLPEFLVKLTNNPSLIQALYKDVSEEQAQVGCARTEMN
jgi:hypothetical protein